jgi:hypothetical protein
MIVSANPVYLPKKRSTELMKNREGSSIFRLNLRVNRTVSHAFFAPMNASLVKVRGVSADCVLSNMEGFAISPAHLERAFFNGTAILSQLTALPTGFVKEVNTREDITWRSFIKAVLRTACSVRIGIIGRRCHLARKR